MLDLNNAAIFIYVVHFGNFSAAGKRLNIPTNTISRKISALEQQLGTRLINRSTRKVTPTTEGKILYERWLPLIDDLQNDYQQFLERTENPSGKVFIAVPRRFFSFFKYQWLDEFLTLYPNIELEFMLTDKLVDLVSLGLDAAVFVGSLENSSLIAQKIREIHGVLVATPEYLEKHGACTNVEDLKKHHFLLKKDNAGPQKNWELHRGTSVTKLIANNRLVVDELVVALEMALNHLGITILPITDAQPLFDSGTLVRVLPEYVVEIGDAYFLFPSRNHHSVATTKFIEFMKKKNEIVHV